MKKWIAALSLAGLGAAVVAGASAAPGDPLVNLSTNKGVITIQVYKKDAPITANNFLDLVKRGFYKNMVFHRVVREPRPFVIQTGDPRGNGTGGFVDPKSGQERNIPLEVSPNLRHDAAGVVAMARSSDPNSASSQFYITLDATPFLDNNYAVFGRVVKGMNVVDQIQQGDKFLSAKLAGAPAKPVVKPAAKPKPVAKPKPPAKAKARR